MRTAGGRRASEQAWLTDFAVTLLWAVYDSHTVGLLACVIVILNVTEPQPCDKQGNRSTAYILSGVPGLRDFQCGFPI